MKKIALLGFGNIAQDHLEACRKVGLDPICALAQRISSLENIKSAKLRAYHDLTYMLEKEELDGAIVCSPNTYHPGQIAKLLDKDIAVLCEKPLGAKYSDAKKLKKYLEKDPKFLFATNNLYLDGAKQVSKIIKSGVIGKPYFIDANWMRSRGIPRLGGWFTSKNLSGGGVLQDLGVHLISCAWSFLEFEKYQSSLGLGHSLFSGRENEYLHSAEYDDYAKSEGKLEVEDFFSGTVLFKNDKQLKLTCSWAANIPDEDFTMKILCSNGSIIWNRYKSVKVYNFEVEKNKTLSLNKDPLYLDFKEEERTDLTRQLSHFKEIICGEKKSDFDLKRAIKVQQIIRDLYQNS